MPHCKKSKHSHTKKSKECKKEKCFCIKTVYVPNPTYSVEDLSLNPLSPYKTCSCCCKRKCSPVNSTVVVVPIPVSSF